MVINHVNEHHADKSEDQKLLADFLRTRRERLTPQQVGLAGHQRRRTPGLRREEVAQLAGLSLTWYTWLEQARDISVSAQVLTSLANALQLSDDERRYLFKLAGKRDELNSWLPTSTVNPTLQAIIDNQGNFPAYLMGRYWDFLAWNRAACAIFGDLDELPAKECNLIWYTFMNPEARTRIVDWSGRARRLVAEFRVDCSPYLIEPGFITFVDSIKRNSAEFSEWWKNQDVFGRVGGRREFNHPDAGLLVFEQTTFYLSSAPDIKLIVHVPGDVANTSGKLAELVTVSNKAPST